ncbi:SulP family sulfate permease [Sphaerotilus hippei]|uniref:SulP family sulfate permease n=1 Tax=Sphaerotilus hippei TaxID=744406 RepID=A0A318GW84_9BURK|nr:SulP family inorganic anion transporter [Sphaerotilus hippei]PXW93667.1 SulP family sulfate permease [Sphaerotilus hippei]
MSSPPSSESSPVSLTDRLHRFRPRLLDTLDGYDKARFGADVGAGLTVGIVALPLAMAFAIASGVKPEQGIYTAIIAGFLISALGGSQVQIGGPAGAFIVIVYGIVERYGLANLLISTMMAGVLLMLMGWLKLGALVRYLPVSIVIGFTNGIAVLIALSQVRDLLGLDIDKLPADFFAQIGTLARHADSFNPWALLLGTLCVAGLSFWSTLFKSARFLPAALREGPPARAVQRIPAPIVALVSLTLLASLLGLPVETIGSRFGGIPQGLPAFALPEFTWSTAKQLLIPTLTIALLGAIESLLCARVADNMIEHRAHDPNQELMAQGVANLVAPLFGGIPATGTIARTVTNVRAGAASPVAGMVHALSLLLVILVAAPLAVHVPLAVLAGILLVVAWNMGEWREFAHLRHFNLTYRIVLVGTFLLTVIFDLTVAVEVGLILACVFFIWRMGQLFRVEPAALNRDDGVIVRRIYGALFFGAVDKIEALPEQMPEGSRVLILEASRLIAIDSSGLDALKGLHRQLQRRGVRLLLADLNEQPRSLMERAGFDHLLGQSPATDTLEEALRRARPEATTAGTVPA